MPNMPTTRKKKTAEPVVEIFEEAEPVAEELEPIIAPAVEEDTITFKRSHFFYALSGLTFIAGLLIGYFVWGSGLFPNLGSGPRSAALANGPVIEASPTAPQYTRYKIPSAGFYSTGPANAPITIVEFSDYECPFCRRWHQEVYQPLLAAYPGKIRLVYRNLPLTSIHPDAQAAAEAAMCAGEQNVYWQYHDKLFNSDVLGNAAYDQYAKELNLNMATFEDCTSKHKYQAAIKTDSDFALNLGISSTPTFFINGLAVVGAQPLDVFKQVIDKELAGEIPNN